MNCGGEGSWGVSPRTLTYFLWIVLETCLDPTFAKVENDNVGESLYVYLTSNLHYKYTFYILYLTFFHNLTQMSKFLIGHLNAGQFFYLLFRELPSDVILGLEVLVLQSKT